MRAEIGVAGDLDTLQGEWRIVALETDGEKVSAALLDGARIVVKGDTFASLGMGGTYEGTVRVETEKVPGNPRRHGHRGNIDLIFTAGHATGTRNLGIYRIVGGRWTMCLATRGTARPKTFATKAGSGIALETLVRDDRAAKAPKVSQAAKTSTRHTNSATSIETGHRTPIEGEWAMVSAVFSGKPMDPSMVQWCTRITRGNLTTITAGPQTMLKAIFALKPGKTHAVIEYMNLHGANKGKTQAGIYELDGDILKFCLSEPGQAAPNDFSSKRADGRSFTVWKRLKE